MTLDEFREYIAKLKIQLRIVNEYLSAGGFNDLTITSRATIEKKIRHQTRMY